MVNNGVDAVEFYKRAFGAVVVYRYNGPDDKSIIYVKLRIGDSPVLLSDEFPDTEGISCRSPKSIGGITVVIHIYTEDVDKLFNQAISAGATVITPVTDMFLGRQIWTINGSLWSLLVDRNT